MEHKRLFLLDAYALIFRAYYALIKMPRITSTGLNTSAVFGFVNTLEELLRKEKPTHIAICFDPPGPTFRHEAFEAYKGEREATPEDIKISVPIIKEIIRAYRIPIIEIEGYEADDVIGTLATKAGNEGFSTFMMTPDKDFGQLVSDNVFQYKPGYRGGEFEIRGVKEVCERYEISSPDKVIDLLALMGDKVDNIPGCPGVGEKTAIKLINDFGSIENLIENTDSLKGALKKKVEDNKEQIVFSKFLATIKTDVPIDCDIEELKLQQADIEELTSIFRRLEFRTLIDKIAKKNDTDTASKISAQPPQAIQGSLFDDISEEEPKTSMKSEIYEINTQNYHIIKNSDEIGEIERFIAESGECAVFIVAQGDSDMTAQWVGTALALHNGKTYYIDNAITGAKEFIVSLHANEKIKVISSQTKRDYVIISNSGLSSSEPIRNYYDITIAHYLLQPEIRHSIDNLAL
ncbi:MAG: DNA polymerase I, partial [Muribaculaceae bacterium]|nr:DNA polymerase I [Muribaculaceae bacterium]